MQAGPIPAGPDAPADSPGGGTKKGVSFDVYNPGDDKWDLELGPDGTLQGAGSAGAIIRGTNCGDPFASTLDPDLTVGGETSRDTQCH